MLLSLFLFPSQLDQGTRSEWQLGPSRRLVQFDAGVPPMDTMILCIFMGTVKRCQDAQASGVPMISEARMS